MIGIDHQPTPQPRATSATKSRIPLWRRVTALFTLSFMTIVGGLLLAGVLGLTALMILFVLERAIAT